MFDRGNASDDCLVVKTQGRERNMGGGGGVSLEDEADVGLLRVDNDSRGNGWWEE
jgi:hypothetical protein